MRRLDSMAWMLGCVLAAGSALVVTFAHAASPHPVSGEDRWSAEEAAVLATLSLKRLPPVPVDPSNSVERLPAAVDLGKRLFNDARFGRNGAVSCASCSELTHRHGSGTNGAHAERAPIELTDAEAADLVSFLGTLSTERQSASAEP